MIYAMLIPVLVYYAIFKFGPMFGLYISFIDYKPARGIFGSKFVGLKWFKSFFSDYYFGRLLINTVRIAVADLLTFPLPVILALLINELKTRNSPRQRRRFCMCRTLSPQLLSAVSLSR